MAMYNRGNILRYAVESVIRSTFTDWELLVIGDACTDDTVRLGYECMMRGRREQDRNRRPTDYTPGFEHRV